MIYPMLLIVSPMALPDVTPADVLTATKSVQMVTKKFREPLDALAKLAKEHNHEDEQRKLSESQPSAACMAAMFSMLESCEGLDFETLGSDMGSDPAGMINTVCGADACGQAFQSMASACAEEDGMSEISALCSMDTSCITAMMDAQTACASLDAVCNSDNQAYSMSQCLDTVCGSSACATNMATLTSSTCQASLSSMLAGDPNAQASMNQATSMMTSMCGDSSSGGSSCMATFASAATACTVFGIDDPTATDLASICQAPCKDAYTSVLACLPELVSVEILSQQDADNFPNIDCDITCGSQAHYDCDERCFSTCANNLPNDSTGADCGTFCMSNCLAFLGCPADSISYNVVMSFTASGAPDDFPEGSSERQTLLDACTSLAGFASTPVGTTMTITAASIAVDVNIPVQDASAATAAKATITTNAGTTAALQSSLQAAGVSVTVTSAATAQTAQGPTADDSDPCFPSSALITKADGTRVTIAELKEGDEIVAATADGSLTTDTVSLLSIAKPEAEAVSFLTLTTEGKDNLTLTAEHHLPVGAACCSTLKQAKDVAVGETVWAVKNGAAVATTVTKMIKATKHGLHSPVLTNGGFPVVDGLVTSFDSIDKVTLAKHGLASLIAACKATGTCAIFRDMFLGADRKYIA
mmetsp:Transcript_46064/g.120671  ORF Transcript_46064/g.120671 Transcript_46064/m.120671 type:complete len:646 (-) Transcript_46064:108-2045(-)|eukprot:CAMPEP_0115846236 /NCGR_PEP_ID=MMETSP0287-20121206/9758_1 /TAXON_ID=412157 /ORGANISM="Chrysochromulina rotalis, Strain UIO044" /LENGTH=645 /DNA_ID=CAMNT_0003300023 /DNA_START=179 /DNA_END=2116 /DNA_ORIENTATION=+